PPAPPPPAATQDDGFRWGHVLYNVVEPSTIRPGEPRPRIARSLEPRVSYTRPECLAALGICLWEQHPTDPRRQEMDWPGDPTRARALEDLGRRLQSACQGGRCLSRD